MSKIVKGAGRVLNKVRKGVWNATKKFAKSKIGKVIIGAALIYFGGAALMGAFGSGAAATAGAAGTAATGLSGAAANIGAAWTSLGTAGSQLLAGNLGNAASALGSGIGGSAATIGANGSMLVNGVAQGATAAANAAAATPGMSVAPLTPTQSALQSALGTSTGINTLPAGVTTGAPIAGGAAPTGIVAKMMASPYAAPALITSGTQLVGGVMQGYGARQEQKRQDQMAEDQRATYNRNIAGFKY